MANIIIYDWLSFTTKIHSLQEVKELLGLSHINTWVETKGAFGYQDRLYFEKISIHYNGKLDMGIWVEMSGQGCRAYETYGRGDFDYLFDLLIENKEKMNINRLDVALDDTTGILNIDDICNDTQQQNYISLFDTWQVIYGSGGNSLLLGSKTSEIIIRIYDKAKERNFTDGRHWVRIEIQMRRDRAYNFIKSCDTIGFMFSGVLNRYIRYITPSKDSNKRRWKLRKYWQKILTTAERISLHTKVGVNYNLDNLDNFVYNQAGSAIQTYINVFGEEKFIEMIKEKETKNPKYSELQQKTKDKKFTIIKNTEPFSDLPKRQVIEIPQFKPF